MALARLARQAKRPFGLCAKMTAVAILGLCFIVVWSIFSSPSSSLTTQRESFDDISQPVSSRSRSKPPPLLNHNSQSQVFESNKTKTIEDRGNQHQPSKHGNPKQGSSNRQKHHPTSKKKLPSLEEETNGNGQQEEEEEVPVEEGEGEVVDGKEEIAEGETNENGDSVLVNEGEEKEEEDVEKVELKKKPTKYKGPVFDPKAKYSWRMCHTRSKFNYIPCIDMETVNGKLQSYRHRERSCPRNPLMCLVPLPHQGYGSPVRWPESKLQVLYKNVAHPKLADFVKRRSWVVQSGEYLTFPQNQTEFKGGVQHYLDFIEEMVPDIEWGKNIRVVLDIGCSDSTFAASLIDKDVLTLSLGLKDDLVDIAQVTLERGFPAIVSPFGNRRLPFPSGVFDVIHCFSCGIPWHSNEGKRLLEMNRLLRPGGYFILSTKHDNIEVEEDLFFFPAMTKLTASLCWNILAHKTDEDSDVGIKIYQKPDSNDIYELRRKKNPPMCKETENPDAAWYVSMKICLHPIPSSIEQRGTEWPVDWPKRLETYPEWMSNKERLVADSSHWKSIVDKSYLAGIGIDWSSIRNVMDMKAIHGGYSLSQTQKNLWVMNVVPVHAPDTLPIVYERGLMGIYHDWCESFSTYPRSYDLLHADHLFSRLKNRCKQPVSIVVEMDRILRPGGWVIVRDKVEILVPLEEILRSLKWEIRLSYAQDKEGILCAQKTMWRP
ncbi:Probable methyltransferase PMT28 [Linum perenne]